MATRRRKGGTTHLSQGRQGLSLVTMRWSSWPVSSRLRRTYKSIASRTPGTQAFRRRCQRRLLAASQDRVTAFRSLKSLDQPTRTRLAPYVRQSLHLLGKRQEQRELVIFVVLYGLMVLGGAWSMMYGPRIVQGWMALPSTHIDGPSIDAVRGTTVIAFLGLLWPTQLLLWIKNKLLAPHYWSDVVLGIGFPTCLALAYSWVGYQVSTDAFSQMLIQDRFIIFAGLFGAILLWLTAVVGPVLVGILLIVQSRRLARARYPQAAIVQHLVAGIAVLESKPTRWATAETKRQCMTHIERAAVCFERHLARSLSSGDAATDTQFKQDSRRMAMALRQTKQGVFSPVKDGQHGLAEKLITILDHAACGNWNQIERGTVSGQGRSERVWLHVRSAGQTLLFAGLPLFVAMVIALVAPALPDGVKLGGLLLCGLWALFRIITPFDPHYSETIAALKEVIGFIPFVGRNGK